MNDLWNSDVTLHQLTLITGLTDRTLRQYLANGLLEGEKRNGVWHFTPEQVNALITNPAVRPAILAKKNAIIYDFLLDGKKQAPACCVILDVPGLNCQQAMAFFGTPINAGTYKGIHFSYDNTPNGTPRVILKGAADDVLQLVNAYQNAHKA